MKTELNFQILEDYKDEYNITVLDKSVYNSNVPISNPLMEVVLPNYTTKSVLFYNPNKINVINNTHFNLGTGPLISGLWTFRFSVNPNLKIFQEFSTLIIGPEIKKLMLALCADISPDNVLKIGELKDKLELAKFTTETCNPTKGLFLFNETVKEINGFIKC